MQDRQSDPMAASMVKGCPLDPVLKFLSQQWLVHIIWTLGRFGEMRFAHLQRELPGRVSARVLSLRLKELHGLGLVRRDDKETAAPHVVYALTEEGRRIDAWLVEIESQSRSLALPSADAPA
jgi:DNA-binding HxlR family transcriptional regulator